MNSVGQVLKQIGSIWWTNVLLLLLALAMGVATAIESTTTSELAQIQYYHTDWFQGLLALLGVNATASLLVHWPWNQRNLGFVMTHGSLVIILIGSAVTRFLAFDGSIGIEEGQSVNRVYDRHLTELVLTDLSSGQTASSLVPLSLLDTLEPRELSHGPRLTLGNVSLSATRYTPDAEEQQTFVATTNPMAPAAAEITFSQDGQRLTTWITEGRLVSLPGQSLLLRREKNAEAFAALLAGPAEKPTQAAQLVIEMDGETLTIPLPAVNAEPVSVGNSGLTVHVSARYHHAIVGEGGQMTEGPGTQSNPAVEVVLRRDENEATRMVFAKFPDFTHRPDAIGDVRVQYQAGDDSSSKADVTLIAGPKQQLALQANSDQAAQLIVMDQAIDLDNGGKLNVGSVLLHAQPSVTVGTRQNFRKNRMPALEMKLTAGDAEVTRWISRNMATSFELAGKPYRLEFRNRILPLPFDVQLNRFEIGVYPGGRAPRSYASQVTLTEHADQMSREALISMNAPLVHHGYTFFQSSYDLDGGKRVSFLSVSRDPGRPIVYVGYVGMVLGMLWVLSTRMRGTKPAGGAA